MRKATRLRVGSLAILAGALTMPAWGTLEVNWGGTVSGGTITGGTTCSDGDACDMNGATGQITVVNQTLGTLSISSVGGVSGSPSFGDLTFSLIGTAGGLGSFTFALSDT